MQRTSPQCTICVDDTSGVLGWKSLHYRQFSCGVRAQESLCINILSTIHSHTAAQHSMYLCNLCSWCLNGEICNCCALKSRALLQKTLKNWSCRFQCELCNQCIIRQHDLVHFERAQFSAFNVTFNVLQCVAMVYHAVLTPCPSRWAGRN